MSTTKEKQMPAQTDTTAPTSTDLDVLQKAADTLMSLGQTSAADEILTKLDDLREVHRINELHDAMLAAEYDRDLLARNVEALTTALELTSKVQDALGGISSGAAQLSKRAQTLFSHLHDDLAKTKQSAQDAADHASNAHEAWAAAAKDEGKAA